MIKWIEKVELVFKLCNVKQAESDILLLLTRGDFAIYQQLGDIEKADVESIKEAIYMPFAIDLFSAYKQFAAWRLLPDQTVDVYLVEVWKLMVLFGGIPNPALMCAFVAGLLDWMKQFFCMCCPG